MYDDDDKESNQYLATTISFLHCTGSDDGENAMVTLVVATTEGIEPMTMPLSDATMLAVKLLLAIRSHDDEFAERLLDLFPEDKEGHYVWPSEPHGGSEFQVT